MQPKTIQILKDIQDLITTLRNKPFEVKVNPLKGLWLAKYQRVQNEIVALGIEERRELEKAYSQWWSDFASEVEKNTKPLDRVLPF
jgi:hypothetical protein